MVEEEEQWLRMRQDFCGFASILISFAWLFVAFELGFGSGTGEVAGACLIRGIPRFPTVVPFELKLQPPAMVRLHPLAFT